MLLSRGESKRERWGASRRFPRWADFIIDTSGWQQLEWRSMTLSEGIGSLVSWRFEIYVARGK
jgi:hypothetical protein